RRGHHQLLEFLDGVNFVRAGERYDGPHAGPAASPSVEPFGRDAIPSATCAACLDHDPSPKVGRENKHAPRQGKPYARLACGGTHPYRWPRDDELEPSLPPFRGCGRLRTSCGVLHGMSELRHPRRQGPNLPTEVG